MPPKCEYFGKCSGCSLQHISYELSLSNKLKQVSVMLGKLGFSGDVSVFSGREYSYRSRMDFYFSKDGICLRNLRGSLIPVKTCPISSKSVNVLLSELWEWRNSHGQGFPFDAVKYAIVRSSEFTRSSSVCFVVSPDSPGFGSLLEMLNSFASMTSASNVSVYSDGQFALKGGLLMKESLAGKEILFNVAGFFQNNPFVAGEMLRHSERIFRNYKTRDGVLLDLYGGVGTFSLFLRELFSGIVIVESSALSVFAAKENLKAVENGFVVSSDISSFHISKMPAVFRSKQLFAVIDPPRTGMRPKAIQNLFALSPLAAIYVSCSLLQASKDLAKLSRRYDIKSAAFFDMFPQTNHIELLVELSMKVRKA